MRALLFALTTLASPLFAENPDASLRFGPAGTYSDARVHVFIDADQPPPRCPCYRFTFAVDDSQSGEIRDDKVVLWVVDPAVGEEIRGSHVLDLTPVYEHPESPMKTTQAIFRVPYTLGTGVDMQFQFITMRRKCNDPSKPECQEYMPSVQGSFRGRQLIELSPVHIGELFETN